MVSVVFVVIIRGRLMVSVRLCCHYQRAPDGVCSLCCHYQRAPVGVC